MGRRHPAFPRLPTPSAPASRRRHQPGRAPMSTFQDRHRSDFNNSAGSFGSFGDILWRDAAGDTVLWLMTNNQLIGQFSSATLPFVPPDWHVKAAAEFDVPAVDSADDILWQNDNGALALWRMSGTTVSAIHALGN